MLPSSPSILHKVGTGSPFPDKCHNDPHQDQTHYRLNLHILGVFVILAASTAGVFMPLIASRIRSLRFSPRVLTLGKQFGTGIILATAFIHMMPTAMSNLSSPCLGPLFSENYTAFGGLFILASSLFMHWIEFVAMEHNQQRMQEAAAERGLLHQQVEQHQQTGSTAVTTRIAMSGGRFNVDLGGLGATGVAAAPCPGHIVTVLDEAVCRRSSCSSGSSCVLDHGSLSEDDGEFGYNPNIERSKSSLPSNASAARKQGSHMSHVESYGSIAVVESHLATIASSPGQPLLDGGVKPTDRHHHHLQEVGHSHAHGLELLNDSQRRISTYILEAGVAAHSVIIGISLGVSSGPEFMGLLMALVFHQFFEGFALGARIADLEFDRTYTHYILALIFSLTTPLGAVIGIVISSSYNPTSAATAILIEGVFDAISTGILLYMGYVNLLAVEFNLNGEIRKESGKVKSLCFLSLWTGAAVMAVIGRFA